MVPRPLYVTVLYLLLLLRPPLLLYVLRRVEGESFFQQHPPRLRHLHRPDGEMLHRPPVERICRRESKGTLRQNPNSNSEAFCEDCRLWLPIFQERLVRAGSVNSRFGVARSSRSRLAYRIIREVLQLVELQYQAANPHLTFALR